MPTARGLLTPSALALAALALALALVWRLLRRLFSFDVAFCCGFLLINQPFTGVPFARALLNAARVTSRYAEPSDTSLKNRLVLGSVVKLNTTENNRSVEPELPSSVPSSLPSSSDESVRCYSSPSPSTSLSPPPSLLVASSSFGIVRTFMLRVLRPPGVTSVCLCAST